MNAALDATELVARLRAEHYAWQSPSATKPAGVGAIGKWAGLDLFQGTAIPKSAITRIVLCE